MKGGWQLLRHGPRAARVGVVSAALAFSALPPRASRGPSHSPFLPWRVLSVGQEGRPGLVPLGGV